jgi:hypothetical protein
VGVEKSAKNLERGISDLMKEIAKLIETSSRLANRFDTLNNQVQFLVDYLDQLSLLDDHCFTFPDGETVYATDKEEG